MKHNAMAGVLFVVTAAIGAAGYAQGRHDDRPHGTRLSFAEVQRGAPAPAGRHDEKPHGQKKMKAQAMESKLPEKTPQEAR